MRALGIANVLVLALVLPLASACYRPRVESCRNPISDVSSFSSVFISGPTLPFGFETPDASVQYTLSASTTMPSGDACVQVHSELRDARGALVEVLDTPIRAHVAAGVLNTTPIFHYRSSGLTPMTIHVVALGATLDAQVPTSRFPDAGVLARDAALDDVGSRPADTGTFSDAGTDASPADAGADDAGTDDAGLDASTDDAGLDAAP